MDSPNNEKHLVLYDEGEAKMKKSKKKKKKKKKILIWKVMEETVERWIDDHITKKFDLYEQSEASSESCEAPADLILPLYKHQKEWLAWALKMEESDYEGGILADEMGMGKTLEAIALVLAKREIPEKRQKELSQSITSGRLPQIKSTLVVCPEVAITQWVEEIERSTAKGSVKVLTYYGPRQGTTAENVSGFDFVITTYNIVMNDCKRFGIVLPNNSRSRPMDNENPARRSMLHSVEWERIILDEGHLIKSESSHTSLSIRSLESSYRWVLSGTSIQNSAIELYSLIRFTKIYPYSYYFCESCNCFVSEYREGIPCHRCNHYPHFSWWYKYVARPIQSSEHSRTRRAMFLLHHKVLKTIVLKRKKERAFALPLKTVLIRWDILDTNEEDHYKAMQTATNAKINGFIQEGTLMNNFACVLSLITRLRQAVNHQYIGMYSGTNAVKVGGAVDNNSSGSACGFCHALADDPIVTSCTHVLCKACLMTLPSISKAVLCPTCSQQIDVDSVKRLRNKNFASTLEGFKSSGILNQLQLDHFQTSTKLEALREEIRFMIEGDGSSKGIVFSQFIPFLDLIKYTLDMSGVKSVQLVGSTSEAAIYAVVKQFNEDPDCRIILLSLKAGGVALNLTVASHVFLMDPWWNSAVEDQAQDRIHRIGQHKPIRVIRFLIKDTIEERIFNLQQIKKSGFEGTIGDSCDFHVSTGEDIIDLFCIMLAFM